MVRVPGSWNALGVGVASSFGSCLAAAASLRKDKGGERDWTRAQSRDWRSMHRPRPMSAMSAARKALKLRCRWARWAPVPPPRPRHGGSSALRPTSCAMHLNFIIIPKLIDTRFERLFEDGKRVLVLPGSANASLDDFQKRPALVQIRQHCNLTHSLNTANQLH